MKRPRARAPRGAFALAALGLLGCATAAGRGKVATLASDPGPECRLLGTVSGVNPFGPAIGTRDEEVEWARGDARDQAGRLGATHIRFRPADPSRPDRAAGDAYDCRAPPTPEPAPAGCAKDVDCKGERICESGRCVEPARPAAPR